MEVTMRFLLTSDLLNLPKNDIRKPRNLTNQAPTAVINQKLLGNSYGFTCVVLAN
jgi:hypothetical protein